MKNDSCVEGCGWLADIELVGVTRVEFVDTDDATGSDALGLILVSDAGGEEADADDDEITELDVCSTATSMVVLSWGVTSGIMSPFPVVLDALTWSSTPGPLLSGTLAWSLKGAVPFALSTCWG